MGWLSVTEGVWRIPRLCLTNSFILSNYYLNKITIINTDDYLEIFYHEWRHYYQDINSICDYHLHDRNRYSRYKSLFYKMGLNKVFIYNHLSHHYQKIFKMFISEFPFEKDAINYQIKKCPNDKNSKYFKKLMN